MTPDHSLNTGCFWLETNRHSPRIFNKNASKLDISTVNNKLDFMRSLNLFCIKNTNEFHSKINWEIFIPKNSLPLKKCSVVISVVKCDVCGELLKNQTDIERHKNLHHRLTDSGYENNNKDTEDSNFINGCEGHIMQENCIECNSNTLKGADKVKPYKKHSQRRKSKDAVTKVTLKIGGEVISRVYCKKKYLNKVCSKEQKSSGVNQHENCKNCNEIKDILHNNKMNAGEPHIPLSRAKPSDTEQSDRNEARLRKMAAALVEHELRQKALRATEHSDFFSGEEYSELKDDDAIVPVASDEMVHSNDIDDDIQELLHVTRNVHKTCITDINLESHTRLERETLAKMQDYEIITIDDETCDFEDDCIIIDERLSNQTCLRDEENSYVFHVSSKDDLNMDALDVENTETFTEKRKSFPDNLVGVDHSVLKKQKLENELFLRMNCPEILDTRKTQKEKKNGQSPTIKLSQFALPLRLINF